MATVLFATGKVAASTGQSSTTLHNFPLDFVFSVETPIAISHIERVEFLFLLTTGPLKGSKQAVIYGRNISFKSQICGALPDSQL